jgi:hypothetical protein
VKLRVTVSPGSGSSPKAGERQRLPILPGSGFTAPKIRTMASAGRSRHGDDLPSVDTTVRIICCWK